MPEKLTSLLHDRVDAREELAERARNMVAEVIRDHIKDLLSAAEDNDFETPMNAIAAIVAQRLEALTTEAVQAGAKHAIARDKAASEG